MIDAALKPHDAPDVILGAEKVRVVFNPDEPNIVEAIADVSFELKKGEIIALVGPSGCGKTTLFNVIAGLQEPTSGRVHVRGQDVQGAKGQVGYMLQKDLLLPWRTILDNVRLGLEVRNAAKQEAIATALKYIGLVGLSGFESAMPQTLSGGMRQRVAFARTLALDPDVILLDEPFSAIDFQTRLLLQGEVMKIIRESRKSSVLVTHDIGEAITMADRIIVLTNRPARVKSIHRIDLGLNRDPVTIRNESLFNEYFGIIWSELEMRQDAA